PLRLTPSSRAGNNRGASAVPPEALVKRFLVLMPFALALVGCARPAAPNEPAPEPEIQPAPEPAAEIPSVETVRELLYLSLGGCALVDTSREVTALRQLGVRAFPAYEVVLADRRSHPNEVTQACRFIMEIQTDRRRFVPLAVRRLSAADGMISEDLEIAADERGWAYWRTRVRWGAVGLLGAIGDERDAAHLVPLLSEEESVLRYAAASALADLGGWPELEAMD